MLLGAFGVLFALHHVTVNSLSAVKCTLRPISVIGETSRLLVVDKPHGIPFHRRTSEVDGDPEQEGILGMIRREQAEGRISYTGSLFPVHRLDTVTSGCLVFAKDRDAAGKLSRGFQRRKIDRSDNHPLIRKWYVALVNKKSKATTSHGVVRGDMVASRRGAWKLLRSLVDPAMTQYIGIGAISPSRSSDISIPTPPLDRLVLLCPQTGRTHQLRVALKSLGSPIVGDMLYGGAYPSDRCYLHACAIEIQTAALGLHDAPQESSSALKWENSNKDDAHNCERETEARPRVSQIFICPPSSGLKWCFESTDFSVLWDRALGEIQDGKVSLGKVRKTGR